MNASSYADKIDAFQTTIDNLEPDLPKYPGVSDLFAELRTLLAELRPAHNTVESQRGSQRVAVQVRRELADRGGQIHRRLSAIVACHTGFANPILVSYGINPRTTRTGEAVARRRSWKPRKPRLPLLPLLPPPHLLSRFNPRLPRLGAVRGRGPPFFSGNTASPSPEVPKATALRSGARRADLGRSSE